MSLAKVDPESLVEAPPSAIARAASIGDLLISDLFLGNPQPMKEKGVAQFLREALNTLPNCNLQKVANRIGLYKSHVSMWKSGTHLPSLGHVLLLAEAFSCSLESVLVGDATLAHEPIWIEKAPKTRRKGSIDPNEMFQLLMTQTQMNPPPSLAEIGRRLGIDRTTLSKRFPKITNRLVAERKRVRKEITERLQQDRAKAYLATAKKLVEQGIWPTQNRVWEALGHEFAVFAPIDRDACRRACREAILGIQKIP